MRAFLKAFVYAAQGIAAAVKTQRNFRIHITAAVYVTAFSFFYELTKTEYALLAVVFALVMSCEAVNTAIEAVVDLCSPEYSKTAKLAKDAAAGAVLIAAIFSVIVGIILFGDINVIKNIFEYYGGNVPALTGLILSVVLSVIFIVYPSKRKG